MVTRRLQLDKVNVILGDIVMLDRNDDTLVAADDDNNVFGGGAFQKVLVVRTKEEASKYTLEDVVLPLPGFDVVYPENEIKEAYVEFMAQHSLDPINMKRSQKEYSLPGSYRRIVERPKNVKW